MLLFDNIFMIEFGVKFDFFVYFVILFIFWIKLNFFDSIYFFVQIIFDLLFKLNIIRNYLMWGKNLLYKLNIEFFLFL